MTPFFALAALATAPQGQMPPDQMTHDQMGRPMGIRAISPVGAAEAVSLTTGSFTPAPLASRLATNTTTQMAGLIHFPPKLTDPGWDTAEAALMRLRETLGPDAVVRWDGLFHEVNWFPSFTQTYERDEHILSLINKYGLHSLLDLIPHPWYGSGWDNDPNFSPVSQYRPWGKIPAAWRPLLAQRYKAMVLDYRNALAANGMPEGENAIQFGNEPASGHPGGDDSLPRGTWSGHPLWYECNRDPAFYGGLQVISPAISMMDEPAARRELYTSTVPRQYDWSPRVDHKSMHFRYYNPRAINPEAYAQGYVNELARRARMVLRLGWPRGNERQAQISEGLWVTEGYVASGDCPEPRAECWRRVLKKISQGVPGVLVYTAYRFYPIGGPDGLDWSLPIQAQVPLDAPINALPQGIRNAKPKVGSPKGKAPVKPGASKKG